MAAEEKMRAQSQLDNNFAKKLLEQMTNAVKAKAPKGQLPLRTEQSKQYLKNLADSYFNNPLNPV